MLAGALSYVFTITTEEGVLAPVDVTGTTYTPTGLNPGSLYIFSLKSVGDNGRQSNQATELQTFTGAHVEVGGSRSPSSFSRVTPDLFKSTPAFHTQSCIGGQKNKVHICA